MSPREKGEKEGDNKAWLRTALGPHVCFAFHDNGWLLRTLFFAHETLGKSSLSVYVSPVGSKQRPLYQLDSTCGSCR